MRELKIWRNFIRAIVAFLKPFARICATLYSLYMIYASIGIALFGGMINMDSIKEL